ncbi:TPA: tail fiber domain-containing protein, partial [Escherichia coli]|nr:tail fiber domain-containing protein [Escherichia coli]
LGGNSAIDFRRGPNESCHLNFFDYRTGTDLRNGWFGFGDGQTKDFIWWNDNGQNSLNLLEDGELHITGGKGQKIVMNSEVALSENARLAVKGGNYGLMLRNDGSSFHILTTDLKDSFGSWNNRRPFSYDFADGGLYLGGTETARCLHLGIDGSTRLEDNLFFKAGSRQSMDYMELVHWGASNTGRNNVLSLRDSKGFLAEFERLWDNTTKNTFFGKMKINRGSDAIIMNAESGDSSVYLLGTCADNNNWYIGKGGGDNGLAFYSYATNAAINLTNAGDIALSPKGVEMVHVNNARLYVHGERWTASQPGDWGNQWRVEAPIFVDHGYVGQDCYYPIVKARSLITNQGYTTAVDFGMRRIPNNWGQAIIRVGSAENSPDNGHPQAVFEFHHDGFFYTPGNGSFNDVHIRSDERLKINKEELEEGALDKLNSLTVYSYDKVKSLSDDTVVGRELGVIAQDVEKVMPEAVHVCSDGDTENPGEIKTISVSSINALFVKAFQELTTKYDAMNEELKAVKAELAAIKSCK